MAFVQISLEKHSHTILEAFESRVNSYDEVLECFLLTGSDADYQLKVLVEDMIKFREFLLDKLTSHPNITAVHSSFVLKQVKNNTSIPLP